MRNRQTNSLLNILPEIIFLFVIESVTIRQKRMIKLTFFRFLSIASTKNLQFHNVLFR